MSYEFSPGTAPALTIEKANKPVYNLKKTDAVFAVLMLVLGFLFWELLPPEARYDYSNDYPDTGTLIGFKLPGLGATLFFLLALAICFVWMSLKGFRQNIKSGAALLAAVLGSLPFFLYGDLPIHIFLFLFELLACLIWVCFTCRTEIVKSFGGFVFFDAVNQAFIVPFANFSALPATKKVLAKRGAGRRLIAAFIGVVVSVPLIFGVLALLMHADNSFKNILDGFTGIVGPGRVWSYLWKILLGIPVALYIFGLVHGNMSKRRAGLITNESAHHFVDKAHRIPSAAVYAPLIILCIIYLIFIAALAGYLTAAFGSDLPGGYTYAEYARRGFFELCAVAAINLCALGFAWLFSKRKAGGHPKPLRIIGGTLTALTLLLIMTAASKMIMYVDAYGLSRLRLYTLWFLLVLACTFIVLLIWHIRPSGAGKPLVITCVILFLSLYLANTDGMIARYNVKNYLDGGLKTVDVEMLVNMSDATAPWLYELYQNAPDSELRLAAKSGLDDTYKEDKSFNLQSKVIAENIHKKLP
ncbi:MAG: DUF4173 domain-containing protein [Clostridiales Family XIII bacterium]|jgi:hypothetical protein|nr:DUF4173 domain-containing protein [Clostridiales Family XIII bacterium]